MALASEDMLKREVQELTALLRHDPKWRDLRDALKRVDVRVDDVFLAGFFENEEDREYGAIVTAGGAVIEFERSSLEGSVGFVKWRAAASVEEAARMFPAVPVAVKMLGGPESMK